MAVHRKPVSIDTMFQAFDEVDKRVKSKTQIANDYGVFHHPIRLGTHLLHVFRSLKNTRQYT
jgi:hypothetical protein